MIKVNWKKIKPYEKASFALPAICAELAVLLAAVIISFINPLLYMPLKVLTAVFVAVTFAFGVHIESRMLQIYMLLGVLDISMLAAVLLPLPTGLTGFFFAASLFAALASAGVAVFAGVFFNRETRYEFPETDRSGFFGKRKVMFFAPHEDDEINLYGGVIEQYVKHGSEVYIVFSTNGDFYRLGRLRIMEALRAGSRMGVDEKHIIFLGFSDSITNKSGIHIYNCRNEELLTSAAGFSQTYGTEAKPPFEKRPFTREQCLGAFTDVIERYMPDTIFCCDYDGHADHRAISLFFEEALDGILERNAYYSPEVFKGFAYSTAWDGEQDFYSQNALATRLREPCGYMRETGAYRWDDRVRFPVAKESLSRVMQNTSPYLAMREYSSQTATDHANGIINSDKVFWRRRTDSVLKKAQISATSGDASFITDFKLVDSGDIANDNSLPAGRAWVPERSDQKRIAAFRLPHEEDICAVDIYPDPRGGKITNARLTLGLRSYDTGELHEYGPTRFEFPPIRTDTAAVQLISFTGDAGLLKVEAFTKRDDPRPRLIKAQDASGNFCYDYITGKSGREEFTVYSYPQQDELEFTAESSSDGVRCKAENGAVKVFCPEGESAVITVRLKECPDIYDAFTIRNPDERERYITAFKQENEQKMWSLPMQWDYYRGLLRRLGVYRPQAKKKAGGKSTPAHTTEQ